jgi:uncharacterized repeat protein (TIGR01451 family)
VGSVLNNNNFTMERVAVDPGTVDSSSAALSLPAGARVLFAGLYYGARTNAGTGGRSAPDTSVAALGRVDLKVPGAGGYDRLAAQVDQSTEVTGAYAAFVDVTAQVQRAGPGTYTVANVQAATGEDRYAGWALVVAYEAPGDPPRNLTVFDGLQSVTQSKPALTIPVSGFQTPLSGPVRTRLGFVAYEGDRGLTGDSATLDGKPLTDAVNPANNLFNSAISIDGRNLGDKTPDYVNQLGFDAKLLRIDGVLANGATSANIALRTSSDQYLPHVITFATDLYAPVVRATKTVVNLTHPDGPTGPGDTLRYTVTYTNDGLEAATNFVATDQLPTDTTYQAGSLRIGGVPPALAAPTDLGGDDLGEYDAAAHSVRFYLGSGARAGVGGSLAVAGVPGDSAQISFDARVDDDVASEREIRNVAVATFTASTSGKQLSALSSEAIVHATPAPIPSEPADLSLAQSETVAPDALGQDAVDDQVTIDNHGPGDATDVVLHDLVPPGATVDSAAVDQGTCTTAAAPTGATDVTCVVAHLDSGGSVVADVIIAEPEADAAAGSLAEATVTAAQLDPTPGNDSDAATAPMPVAGSGPEPNADLAVDDRASASQVPLGGALTESITIVNRGPDAATGIDVSDALSGAAEVLSTQPGAATCPSVAPLHCTIATLPAGGSETIAITLRPLRPGRFNDAATAGGDQTDPDPANNSSAIEVAVRPQKTAARLRIVPITPVASAGRVVSFIVTATVTGRGPGVMPRTCVTLPASLRLVSAPGAIVDGPRVCRDSTDLIGGAPRSFVLRARIRHGTVGGTPLAISGRLTGANFAAAHAAGAVLVPARPVVACPATVVPPRARVAC